MEYLHVCIQSAYQAFRRHPLCLLCKHAVIGRQSPIHTVVVMSPGLLPLILIELLAESCKIHSALAVVIYLFHLCMKRLQHLDRKSVV